MEYAKNVKWDLSKFYKDHNDPQIEIDINNALNASEKFAEKYKGKINVKELSPSFLLEGIKEEDNISIMMLKPYNYIRALISSDLSNNAYKTLFMKVNEALVKFNNNIMFFSLEISELSEKIFKKLIEAEELKEYRLYLENLHEKKHHLLSEKEEQLAAKLGLVGKSAFQRLYSEFTSSFRMKMKINGEKKILSGSEIRAYFENPDEKIRKEAFKNFYKEYEKNSLVLSHIFNNIVKNNITNAEIRKYKHPIEVAHTNNYVDSEVIRIMLDATKKNYHLAQRYYKLKAKYLKKKKIEGYSLYVPIGKEKRNISFKDAKNMVLSSYGKFDPEIKEMAEKFFDNNWIDAELRKGKASGAFCSGNTPLTHPLILMNYNGNLGSVYTLAHELGHGIHNLLAVNQPLKYFYAPLVLAETASIFGEMLLTDHLDSLIDNKDEKINLLASKIEDFISTAFRQAMYTFFELDIYEQAKNKILSGEEISNIWNNRVNELYGDSVLFTKEQRWNWASINHFINYAFYCYAYTFGMLFVIALYEKYKESDKSTFVDNYKNLLRKGSSEKPVDAVKIFSIDLYSEDYWLKGFEYISGQISKLENML